MENEQNQQCPSATESADDQTVSEEEVHTCAEHEHVHESVSKQQVEEMITTLNTMRVVEESNIPYVDNLIQVIRVLQHQEAEYAQLIRGLTQKLAEVEERSSTHDTRCAQNVKMIEELRAQKAELESRLGQTQNYLRDAQCQLNIKTDKNIQQQLDIDKLSASLNDTTLELKNTKATLLDTAGRLHCQTAKLESSTKSVGQLRLEIEARTTKYQRVIADQEAHLRDVRRTLESKSSDAKDLSAQVVELQRQLRCRESAIKDLEARNDRVLHTSSLEVKSLERDHCAKMALANKQIDHLQGELKTEKAGRVSVQARLDSSTMAREKDTQFIRNQEDNIKRLRTERGLLDAKNLTFRGELEKLVNRTLTLVSSDPCPCPQQQRISFQNNTPDECILDQTAKALKRIDALDKAFVDQSNTLTRERRDYQISITELEKSLSEKTKQVEQAACEQMENVKWKESVKRMLEHDNQTNNRLRAEITSAMTVIQQLKDDNIKAQVNETQLVSEIERLERRLASVCPDYCRSSSTYRSTLHRDCYDAVRDQISSALDALNNSKYHDMDRLTVRARMRLREAEESETSSCTRDGACSRDRACSRDGACSRDRDGSSTSGRK